MVAYIGYLCMAGYGCVNEFIYAYVWIYIDMVTYGCIRLCVSGCGCIIGVYLGLYMLYV